jgi:hypothetical protein
MSHITLPCIHLQQRMVWTRDEKDDFTANNERDPCDDFCLPEHEGCPTSEGLAVPECTGPIQSRILAWYGVNAVLLIASIVLGLLAALDAFGDVDLDRRRVYTQPADWFWVLALLLWVWLAAGLAVGASIVYRSLGVEYVTRGLAPLALALAAWSAALLSWFYEPSHVASLVLVVFALGGHFASMNSLYLSRTAAPCRQQPPPFRVYLFWIASHAFATGFALVVFAFLLETIVGGGRTPAALLVYLVPGALAAFIAVQFRSWAFLIPVLLALIGYENGLSVDNRVAVAVLAAFVVNLCIWFYSVIRRLFLAGPGHKLSMFLRRYRAPPQFDQFANQYRDYL